MNNSGIQHLQQYNTLSYILDFFKGCFKCIRLKIIISLTTTLLVYIIHTFLLVVVNDGFSKRASDFLGSILAIDRYAATTNFGLFSQTFFWYLFSLCLWGLIFRIIFTGPIRGFSELLKQVGRTFRYFLAKPGSMDLARFFFGILFSILIGLLFFNPYLCLMLSTYVFLSASKQYESLLYIFPCLVIRDIKKLFDKKADDFIDITNFNYIFSGLIVGGIIAFILTSSYMNQVLRILTLAAIIALTIVNLFFKSKNKQVTSIIIFLFSVSIMSIKIFADDGGWTEAGKNLGNWINSPGRDDALGSGIGPAIGGFLGSFFAQGGAGGSNTGPSSNTHSDQSNQNNQNSNNQSGGNNAQNGADNQNSNNQSGGNNAQNGADNQNSNNQSGGNNAQNGADNQNSNNQSGGNNAQNGADNQNSNNQSGGNNAQNSTDNQNTNNSGKIIGNNNTGNHNSNLTSGSNNNISH